MIKKFKILLHAFWALPFLLIFRKLGTTLGIKIICIRADKIGHFIPDSSEQLVLIKNKKVRFRIYCLNAKPINKQWYKMLKSKMLFINVLFYVYVLEKKIFSKMLLCEYATKTKSRDVNGYFSKYDFAQLNFEENDQNECIEWMNNLGIKKNDKIICLLVRDGTFLKTEETNKRYGYEYHNYRNVNIENYEDGIYYLLSEGYWVIRMGRTSSKFIEISHPNFIDYSRNHKLQSDLLDIWLLSQCYACISSGTGPDMIPLIYNKPICFVNFIPLAQTWSFANCLIHPKKLFDQTSNQMLSANEILEKNYVHFETYRKNSIEIVELDNLEIKQTFREFHLSLNKQNDRNLAVTDYEKNFIQLLINHPSSKRHHHFCHNNFRFADCWIKEQLKINESKNN